MVGDVAGMSGAIDELLRDPEIWAACSRAARAYYERRHTVQAVAAAYDELFRGLGDRL